MPTREDVDLARAAIDRGLLTIKESVECLEIQRDYEKEGRQVPLERIFIETQLLTDVQLAGLKESLARAAAMRQIGHYELLSKVGAGGMGVVYKAKDAKAQRIVALKVLSPGHASNREYIERFLREAHASGRLSHPNIVQGYDAGEAGGQYYFAMEFVDGITVGDMLKDGRPIPEQQALDIAIQTAKALQHAEEHNLIHRDIKPDNIMITHEGAAKLADLGLARLAKGDPAAPEGKAFGTPYYASPEQCEGIQELDTKTDMYSFGATLFHMLVGRVPFNDETPEGILEKHLKEKPAYIKDLNVQLSHGVSKIVRKLMAKRKRNRYASMADVVKDLTLVRMGRSPRLGERSQYDSGEYRYRSSTGSWRTKKPTRWRKVRQIAACVVLGLVILVAGYYGLQYITSGPDEPPPEKPRPNGGVVTSAPAGVTPKPPARAPDEVYLDTVLASRTLSREDFYQRLRAVVTTYPGTKSATRAEEEAARIMQAMEAGAEPLFKTCQAEAVQLRDGQKYQAALDKLAAFPAEYRLTRFAAEIEKLRTEIDDKAKAEFDGIKRQATALAAEKKYDEAIALYTPAIQTFGVQNMTTEANTAVRELQSAKAAEEKRVAEEAKKEAERQRLAKDMADFQAAAKSATALVGTAKFGDAATAMKSAAEKLTGPEHKASVVRAAADLEVLQKLLDALKGAQEDLKGKPVAIARKDKTRLEGDIFSISDTYVSLECKVNDMKAIRTVRWEDLAGESLRSLITLKQGGKLTTEESCAVAALFFFSGMRDEATGVLDKLAAEDAGAAENPAKTAAELRRKDYELFSKDAAK